uniref:Uncharacterized protein n=1 Tax=Anabas testudineus TaxID=64144 RepID=A0A3Q1J9R1_ANATE
MNFIIKEVRQLRSNSETIFVILDHPQSEDYRSRWRSIRVMYFTMFLSSVGEEDTHDEKIGIISMYYLYLP